MQDYLPTLRLCFPGGVYNAYRLRDGRLEFRVNEGSWRTMDDSELQLHHRFDTEVSRWLHKYLAEANPYAAKILSRAKMMSRPQREVPKCGVGQIKPRVPDGQQSALRLQREHRRTSAGPGSPYSGDPALTALPLEQRSGVVMTKNGIPSRR